MSGLVWLAGARWGILESRVGVAGFQCGFSDAVVSDWVVIQEDVGLFNGLCDLVVVLRAFLRLASAMV